MSNRHHTTAEQRKSDRERTKALQKAQREAVEVCRMLLEERYPPGHLSRMIAGARRVIDQIDGVK